MRRIASVGMAKDTSNIQIKLASECTQVSAIGDLVLALESDCVTFDELEYIEQMIDAHAKMQVS